jgi:hypothetical protein
MRPTCPGMIVRGLRPAVVLLLCFASGVAACGNTGGISHIRQEPPPRSTHIETRAKSDEPPRSDRRIAHGALLSIGELGAGWRPTTARSGRRCAATDAAWTRARATAVSTFGLDQNVLQQTVAVFADEQAARHHFVILGSIGARRCLYGELHRGIAATAGAHVDPVRTIRFEENEASRISAIRAAATVDSLVGLTSIYIDQIRAWTQRAVSVVLIIQVGSPVDEAVYDSLVARLKRRVTTAFG